MNGAGRGQPLAGPATASRRVLWRTAVALLALASASAAGAGLALDPATACGLLDDQGLRTREGYREHQGGLFQCASIPHRWPRGAATGDELRFVATGTRGQVRELRLDLWVRSRGDLRAVLAAFASLAQTLSERALGQPLPLEARQAIAAGVPGTWRVAGAEVALERIAGAVPGLRLVWR